MYPNTDNYTQGGIILNGGDYEFAISSGTDTVRYALMDVTNTPAWTDTNIKINQNEWSHILIEYNGNNINTYINGMKVDSATFSGVMPSTDYLLGIGARYLPQGNSVPSDGWYSHFNGLIDDLRIYNRALNEAEIQELYEMGQPTETVDLTNGLVAHYEFEDNAKDSSGNGNHGEEFGGVSYVDGVIGRAVYLKTPSDYILSNYQINLYDFTMAIYVNIEQNMLDTTYTGTYGKSNTIINGVIKDGYPSGKENSFSLHWVDNEMRFNDSAKTQINIDNVTLDKWTYIVTSRKNGILSLYVDGTLVKTLSSSNTVMNIENMAIGKEFDCEDGCFEDSQSLLGYVDDLRIYNRALNEAEIQELYGMGL